MAVNREPAHYVVGRRFREARERHGLQVAEVANALGVSPEHVRRVERGDSSTPMPLVVAMCNFYQVSPDYAFGFADDPGGHAGPPDDSRSSIRGD